MPELPEVETTIGDLRSQLRGARFSGAHVAWARTVARPAPEKLAAAVAGKSICEIGRRGKYLLFELDSGDTLIIHLRMTGRLRVEPGEASQIAGGAGLGEAHVRVRFDLADGRQLVFTDQRKFGRMWLVQDQGDVLEKLGPEPLDALFTAEVLAGRIRNRRVAIKTLLLDQKVLAGLGNIYADEALFLARIHPLRRATTLSEEEIERLHGAIGQVLAEALAARGTTLRNYRPPLSEAGEYQNLLRVYQHKGQPCPRCSTPIEYLRVGQRGTHFCPRCQLAPDDSKTGPVQTGRAENSILTG